MRRSDRVRLTARYANNFPARFMCLAPWTVAIDFDSDHRRRYKVGAMTLNPADVLHLRYRSDPMVARRIGRIDVSRTRMSQAGDCAVAVCDELRECLVEYRRRS